MFVGRARSNSAAIAYLCLWGGHEAIQLQLRSRSIFMFVGRARSNSAAIAYLCLWGGHEVIQLQLHIYVCGEGTK